MPRCQDSWVRRCPAQVKVTVTRPSHGDIYSLTYVTGPTATGVPQPLEVGTFDSEALANGSATWRVGHGQTSIFTLQTSGQGTLQTTVEIDGQQVSCNSGQHCQGACRAVGAAGLAGYWRVTVWKDKGVSP